MSTPTTPVSPMSPVSPTSPTTLNTAILSFDPEAKQNAEICRVLKKIGYAYAKKLVNTLQGSIWRGVYSPKNDGSYETAVIKTTSQYLYNKSKGIVKGKVYTICEDILLEQSILKYLTHQKHCPKSIIKYHWFFKTHTDFYLVMEDGGISLFEFVKSSHELISTGKLSLSHWKQVVLIIFSQLIECIEYIHSKKVCHFDISLENILINDVRIEVNEYKDNIQYKENIRFVLDDIQIRLCDFGLAKMFTKNEFKCRHFCGKQQYKSPEVLNEIKSFDAVKNDIWCMGVCLYMLCTGGSPWNAATIKDSMFKNIMNGYLCDMLKSWNVLHYIDQHWVYIFETIFKYEKERINLNEIKKYFYENMYTY